MATLKAELTEAEDKLKRLYKMVEDGEADLDDLLKQRIAALKFDRERAQVALDRIRRPTSAAGIDPDAIARFWPGHAAKITTGDSIARKAPILVGVRPH